MCPIADIASAQRMGAALSYARRYALFTLVGIAGEDDLDAPDLCDGSLSPSAPAVDRFKPREWRVSARSNADARDVDKRRPPVILDADQSAALREKLLAEMGDIASADLADGRGTIGRDDRHVSQALIAFERSKLRAVDLESRQKRLRHGGAQAYGNERPGGALILPPGRDVEPTG